jgi:hypothetical protein
MKRATKKIPGVAVVFLAFIIVASATEVAAQSIPEFPQRQSIPEFARGLIGVWMRDEPVRGNCGDLVDQNGQPRRNCALPVDQLPLTERARAWIKYFDELQATVYECAAHTTPTLLGDVRPFNISLNMDSVQLHYEMGNTFRYAYTDGRGHPPPYQLFYQGHSIGKWDGNDLVVETTNFTFDVDGMDDHAHLATSARKRVIERYTLVPPDHLKITITLEDPLFLTKPFSWSHMWKKSPAKLFDGFAECDPEVTRREVELTYKDKYIDK